MIGHITVEDPEKWEESRKGVPAALAPWGGEVILWGKRTEVLAGAHPFTDVVVIRLPDADAIARWYRAAEYQRLILTRGLAAEMVLVSYGSERHPDAA